MFAALAPVIVACAATDKSPGKVGVYCHLKDVAGSPTELRRTMLEIKAAGIDFILPDAKSTSGKVNWNSTVAPPALIGNSNFMELVVEEGHRAGLKVYPVFCVATEGGEGGPDDVLKRNPSWAFVVDGRRVGYIDPGNAAARKYEVSLITELVSKFHVDGLSLDYMRAPNRIGYTESARAEFLQRSNVDLANVAVGAPATLDTEGGKQAAKNAAAARSNPIWPEWRTWRREQLNGFMREIHSAVQKARPGLPISSYCWGAQTYTGNFETCQDWKTWIHEGWLDWINPSGYRYTDDAFREAAALNRENVPKGFPFYITIGVKTSHGQLPDVAALRKQMALSKEAGADGLVFFTWESLRKFLPEAANDIKHW